MSMIKEITIDGGVISPPNGIIITSFKYEINSKPDFTGIVLLDTNSNESSIKHTIDFRLYNIAYIRVTAICDDNGVTTEWKSNIFAVDHNTTVNSSKMCYPPNITLHKISNTSHLKPMYKASVNPPRFFMGNAEWLMTSWYIRDIAGNIIKSREYDKNKNEFIFPINDYENIPGIIVEARYEFDTNVNSPRGMSSIATMVVENAIGIDNYTIYTKFANNIVNIVNNRYSVISMIWRFTNLNGTVLDSGSDHIEITGPNAYGYSKGLLFITLNTARNGVVENVFNMEIIDDNIGFPVTLPYYTS